MAKRESTKPSTNARRVGYAKSHGLKRFLYKIFYPGKKFSFDEMMEHWLEIEFDSNRMVDFVMKFTPTSKLGGPEKLPPGKATRRKRRKHVKE